MITQRASDMWINIIKHMLSVDDAHEQIRLNELFLSLRGIATTLVAMIPLLQEQAQQHHQYPYNNTNIQAHKYECYHDMGRQLYGTMSEVGKYVLYLNLHSYVE